MKTFGFSTCFDHPVRDSGRFDFQVPSYADLDKIDVGIYIVPTKDLPRIGFEGSVTFDKVKKCLPHLRSAIQVPVWVVGLTP